MSFFKSIFSEPWLEDHTAVEVVPGGGAATLKTKRIGLFIFIGVATALFLLFSVAYHMRMMMGGWLVLEEPVILWGNTAVLVVGSVLMQMASKAAEKGELLRARQLFFAGGFAGFLFLAGQLQAWKELIDLGCYADVNPANAFFYVITGLHGVHLLGGLFAWGRALVRTTGSSDAAAIKGSIELCDYYWHFMLIVWLGLFGLLLST